MNSQHDTPCRGCGCALAAFCQHVLNHRQLPPALRPYREYINHRNCLFNGKESFLRAATLTA